MRITYDPEADAMYITLKGHGVDHTVRVGADLAIDYGADGEVHGIEILSASRHVGIRPDQPSVELDGVLVASLAAGPSSP
jgi:uncharacterized protein YuzE